MKAEVGMRNTESGEETKYLIFAPLAVRPEMKTRIWAVKPKTGGIIGTVRWFGPWRQYALFPVMNSIYERQCLRDIADFCERKTKEHRSARKSSTTTDLLPLASGEQSL